MAYAQNVQRSIDVAQGREKPLGYVFMIGQKPSGPLRATKKHAVQDAIDAREARVDLQYENVFFNPLAWIAPIWP